MKPYTLNPAHDAADSALIWVVGLVERIAEATDDSALWALVMSITDARLAWAQAHDTTPDTEDTMTHRSHTKDEITKAIAQNPALNVYELDTGNDGEDDILIGETEEGVVADICAHFDMEALPPHWTLTRRVVLDTEGATAGLIFIEEIGGEEIHEDDVLDYGQISDVEPEGDRGNWMTEDEGFDHLETVKTTDSLAGLGRAGELWVKHNDGGRDGARWFPAHVKGHPPTE